MDNTVGSRGNLHWNSREVREIRKNLHLSKIQRAVLIGVILGDGCLAENFWKKQFRLKIEQGNNHKEYIFWLYTVFKNWTLSPPKYLKEREAWRFYTVSHPELTKFRKIFYRNKKKTIPVSIKKLLTHPVSLAVWFMDDGAISRKDGFILNTQNFSFQQNLKLRECLEENFGISEVSIHRDKNRWRLYIRKSDMENFQGIIERFVIPEMKYKFPLTS